MEGFSGRHAPFHDALLAFIKSLPQAEGARFHERPAAEQDNILETIENSLPAMFHVVLELVYMAYYGDPRIQRAIGYRWDRYSPGATNCRRSINLS